MVYISRIKEYGKTKKFQTLFSFCSQINVDYLRAGIHIMLVEIASREDPDQTASSEAV